jgi:hypothetical protein
VGEEWKCFFPQYTMNFLETPMFALNSGYDSWQTSNVWFAGGVDGANVCRSYFFVLPRFIAHDVISCAVL